MDDHEVEIVYDVKLAFQGGKLYATEVDFSHYRALRRLGLRKLARLLTSRNKEARVSWLYVQPLPEQLGSFAGNIKLKVPKAGLSEIHPVDLADILEELEGGQRVALFNALDAEQASETLEEVEPRVQRELIRAIEKERAALLINEMSPAQAADILAILPRDEAGAILKLIDRDISSKVEHIIGEHEEQILLYASPELIKLPATTQAAEVLDRYRELATGKNVVMYIYITDEADMLKGVVDLRDIVGAEPGQTLGDIMTAHVIALPKDASLRDAVMFFERYNFRALPITDENDRLLGAVSSRDVEPPAAPRVGSLRLPGLEGPVPARFDHRVQAVLRQIRLPWLDHRAHAALSDLPPGILARVVRRIHMRHRKNWNSWRSVEVHGCAPADCVVHLYRTRILRSVR